jgi:DNA-binding response OmpR family regulator
MPRLLLVDSSPHTRAMLATVLRRLRYAVTPVETGGEAISRVASDSIAPANVVVVVLRKADPTISGLCTFLRREWSLPIVTITAFADGDVPDCIADATVGKPFDAYQLADAIKSVLARESDAPPGPTTPPPPETVPDP